MSVLKLKANNSLYLRMIMFLLATAIVHWSQTWIYQLWNFGAYIVGSADCESRIKERKYDFGGERFNIKDFWANEAALLTVMLAYNLMSLFRQGVLRSNAVSGKPDIQHTLKTLPYKLFAQAGYTAHSGCKKIINLAVAMR